MTFIKFAGEKFMRKTASTTHTAVRAAILPDFDPSKYEQIFDITSDEILKILQDSVLLQVISKMSEKIFDISINCLFERKRQMLEQTAKDLVEFLIQTTIDIKHNLKYRSGRIHMLRLTCWDAFETMKHLLL